MLEAPGLPLTTIRNANSGVHFLCVHTSKELTATCPRTRIADFYELRIEYVPADVLVELKSLRDYLAAFRDVETYHEPLLNRIFDDFSKAVQPAWLRVMLSVNVRGGIETTVERISGPAPKRHVHVWDAGEA